MSSLKAAYGFWETSLSCSGLSKRKISFYSKKASTERLLQQVDRGGGGTRLADLYVQFHRARSGWSWLIWLRIMLSVHVLKRQATLRASFAMTCCDVARILILANFLVLNVLPNHSGACYEKDAAELTSSERQSSNKRLTHLQIRCLYFCQTDSRPGKFPLVTQVPRCTRGLILFFFHGMYIADISI